MAKKKAVRKQSLSQKGSGKNLTPRRMRRAFKADSHQADIHLIMYRGKRRVIRLQRVEKDSSKEGARRRFIEQKIFHTLFPENSIVPVGIATVKVKGVKKWGMVSEIVKGRSNDYKVYQKTFYRTREYFSLNDLTKEERETRERHRKFATDVGTPFIEKISGQAGIMLDPASVNICNVRGKPVFFEVVGILQIRAKDYIETTVKNEKTKRMLLKLLSQLQTPLKP